MSATAPEATGNDSRGRPLPSGEARARQIVLLLRLFLGAAGVVGGVLLALATSATIIDISIGTTGDTAGGFDTALSGADRHGPALIVIAVFAMVLLVAAVQGIRPAMLAVAACGVGVLGIAILSDARNIDDTGQLRQLYTGAIAGAGDGFYDETLGGALLLISGGGLLVLSGGTAAAPAGHPRPGRRPLRGRGGPRRQPAAAGAPSTDAPADPPAAGDAPPAVDPPVKPRVDDWFAD